MIDNVTKIPVPNCDQEIITINKSKFINDISNVISDLLVVVFIIGVSIGAITTWLINYFS